MVWFAWNIAVPAILGFIVTRTFTIVLDRRFYRGVHRRRGNDHQAGVRGPGRAARTAGTGHHAAGDPGRSPGLNRLPLRWTVRDDLLPGSIADLLNLRGYVMRLYTGQPGTLPVSTAIITSGYGYSSGTVSYSASANQVSWSAMGQQHSVLCQCPPCTTAFPVVPGCNCSWCAAKRPSQLATGTCTCQSCTAFRQVRASGIASSAAGPPPAAAPRSRSRSRALSRGMDGFDGADFVAGTLYGYRWWTLQAPPGVALGLSPAECTGVPLYRWAPGLLRGTRDTWLPGVNQAKCIPYDNRSGVHGEAEIPHPDCADGYWAYWQIQEHEMGGVNQLPVVGVMKGSGNVLMGPRGFRAGKAEIAALYLPIRLDLLTPPAPLRNDPPPQPACQPEEIAEAQQRAQAWMAVIEDRLQQTYPGAEVCASLDYMMRKYPVADEYAAEQERQGQQLQEDLQRSMLCPFCAQPVPVGETYKHISERH